MIQQRLFPLEDLTIQDEKIVKKFKYEFELVRNRECPSNRVSHTGVGKTFEDTLNILENNKPSPDYMNVLEFKSTREMSKSMVTLFTKVPTYPKKINRYLRDNYGYKDETFPNVNVLHVSALANTYRSAKDNYAYKLEINEDEKKIYLRIKNVKTNEIIPEDIYYTFDTLKDIVYKKCRIIAYMETQTRKENDLGLCRNPHFYNNHNLDRSVKVMHQ